MITNLRVPNNVARNVVKNDIEVLINNTSININGTLLKDLEFFVNVPSLDEKSKNNNRNVTIEFFKGNRKLKLSDAVEHSINKMLFPLKIKLWGS